MDDKENSQIVKQGSFTSKTSSVEREFNKFGNADGNYNLSTNHNKSYPGSGDGMISHDNSVNSNNSKDNVENTYTNGSASTSSLSNQNSLTNLYSVMHDPDPSKEDFWKVIHHFRLMIRKYMDDFFPKSNVKVNSDGKNNTGTIADGKTKNSLSLILQLLLKLVDNLPALFTDELPQDIGFYYPLHPKQSSSSDDLKLSIGYTTIKLISIYGQVKYANSYETVTELLPSLFALARIKNVIYFQHISIRDML